MHRGKVRIEYTATTSIIIPRAEEWLRVGFVTLVWMLSIVYSTDALEKDLPWRFSRLLQLPVTDDNGLSYTIVGNV